MMTEVTEAMRYAGSLRYMKEAPTDEQRQHVRQSQLYLHGDAWLVWVNEGDLHNLSALSAIPIPATGEVERETMDAIAAMMSEFVDNWPQPKKVKTALALVAKTMRAALDPPQHVYWRAGEPDCPRELKAGNGELHTLRCKVCGLEDLRANSVCRAALTDHTTKDDE